MTYQDLFELYEDAIAGHADAERDFREGVRLLAKRANRQMARMEKSQVKTESYKAAKDFLNITRLNTFSERTKTKNLNDLLAQAKAASAYVQSKTYSLTRAKYQKAITWAEKIGIDVRDSRTAKNLTRFLESDAWNEYKKEWYVRGSGELTDIAERIASGETNVSDILKAFKDFENKELDIIELQAAWNRG